MRNASRQAAPDSRPAPDGLLANLIAHAAHHSPHYREQFWARRLREGRAVSLAEVPVTAHGSVREDAAAFAADGVPLEEGMVSEEYTAGRTGPRLRVLKTRRQYEAGNLEAVRLRRGWGYEQHGRAVISVAPENPAQAGMVQETVQSGGRRTWRIFSRDAGEVARLLRETRATLLAARPSTAAVVLREHPDIDFVQLIATGGEGVEGADLRQALHALPGCSHFDTYGAAETGLIGASCRRCGRYHVADRHVAVELLDEQDQPVGPGETGRVIVTPLFSLAMPLLRYEIGDQAVRSSDAACGCCGLTLDRIIPGARAPVRRAEDLPVPFRRAEALAALFRQIREAGA